MGDQEEEKEEERDRKWVFIFCFYLLFIGSVFELGKDYPCPG